MDQEGHKSSNKPHATIATGEGWAVYGFYLWTFVFLLLLKTSFYVVDVMIHRTIFLFIPVVKLSNLSPIFHLSLMRVRKQNWKIIWSGLKDV